MNLLQYNIQNYPGTRVDLPLDFIYKQLETKQKEFDAQAAAVDKATENFMKLDYGMLTEDAYKRVMENYLPKLESIRDNLFATGNVAMAAPDLAKFTTDLAGDSEVKNMLKDAQLTETYRQAVQQGLYTDKDLVYLFDQQGAKRPQLQPGQQVQASWYAPLKYVAPESVLGKEADDFVKADISSGSSDFKKDILGNYVNNDYQYKTRRYQKLYDYLSARYDSFAADPQFKAYVHHRTGWDPTKYTKDQYLKELADPLAKALAYTESVVKQNIVPAKTSSTDDGPSDTKNDAPKPYSPPTRTNLQTQVGGIPSYSAGVFLEDNITTFDELEKDLNIASKDYGTSFNEIAKIAGITATMKDGGLTEVRNWINNNYQIKDGVFEVKSGSSAPAITPELHKTFKKFFDAGVASSKGGVLKKQIMDEAGVASYDPKVIQDAKRHAFVGTPEASEILGSDRDYFISDGDYSLEGMYKKSKKYLIEHPDGSAAGHARSYIGKYDSGIIKKERYDELLEERLKDLPEGKIYKVFENFRNRLSQMSLSQFPDNKETDSAEQTMINLIRSGSGSARNAITNKALDKGKLDKEFTKILPYKDGDPAKGVDYSQITTSIGYHPKYGVVGVMSFNGNYFTVSLDDINLDQKFTAEYPDYVTEIRFYQQISDSFKRNLMQDAEFQIGDSKFTIGLKSKNLASSNPDIKYTEKFDGVNEYEYDNLGQIFAKALEIANEKNTITQLRIQDARVKYLNKLDMLANRNRFDKDGADKLRIEFEKEVEKIKKEASSGVVGSSGKTTPQSGDPLGLGR
jgi:hypothetical protein